MTRYAPLSAKRRNPDPPPAYVVGGKGQLQVWTEDGCETAHTYDEARTLIARLNKHAVYASASLRSIRASTGPDGWELFKWGPMIAWERLGKTTVYSARTVFSELGDDQAGRALFFLCEIRRQLNRHGCGLGAWGSMALQLWRATLPHPVAFSSQTMRDGLYGPRKQVQGVARGDVLTGTVYVDLRSAYPTAMVADPIPTRLRRTIRSHLDGIGIARATVTFPHPSARPVIWWAPLPTRRRTAVSWERHGPHESWWTFSELRMAKDAGLPVEVHESWEGIRHVEPFGEWWQIVQPLRRKPGPTGRWFKAVSNSLWGMFAVGNHTPKLITLGASGRPVSVIPVNRTQPMPTAAYVAAEISGRVRERVYREALNDGAVYVDTDGVILLTRGALPAGCQDRDVATDGQWRVQSLMRQCQIKAAQAYRWTGYDGKTRYVVAGLADAGPDTFAKLPIADQIWAA